MPWYGYALLTALTIALVGILQKKTLQNEHSTEYFMVFSVIKTGLFLLFVHAIDWNVTTQQLGLLLLTGCLAGFAFFFVTKALRRLDLSIVSPVLTLDSALGSVIAFLVLGERLSGGQAFGLGLMVIGTYTLEFHRHAASGSRDSRLGRLIEPFQNLWRTPGGIYALLAMIFFALSGVVDRSVLTTVSSTTYLAYVLPTIAVLSIIIFVRKPSALQILRPGSRTLMWAIALTAGVHLLSNVTQTRATGLMAIGLVLAVKRLSTLIDVVLSGRLFHERGLRQKMAASVIMLIGLFFVVRP